MAIPLLGKRDDDDAELEEEESLPDHPGEEWPKNDEVPADGVPLPPDQWTPPLEEQE